MYMLSVSLPCPNPTIVCTICIRIHAVRSTQYTIKQRR
jgi:hypothetical protein